MQFAKITIEANVSFNELALMFNAQSTGSFLEALLASRFAADNGECADDCSGCDTPTTCTGTPTAEEQPAAPAETPFDQKTQYEQVKEMLNHSKYPLRKVSTITDKCDFIDDDDTEDFLNAHFGVVFKTKRETGESLVGLVSRN